MIPEFDQTQRYMIGFGSSFLDQRGRYKSAQIEMALSADSVDMLTAIVDRGWIDKDTRCFDNGTVINRCEYVGAKQCAAYLRGLGWE